MYAWPYRQLFFSIELLNESIGFRIASLLTIKSPPWWKIIIRRAREKYIRQHTGKAINSIYAVCGLVFQNWSSNSFWDRCWCDVTIENDEKEFLFLFKVIPTKLTWKMIVQGDDIIDESSPHWYGKRNGENLLNRNRENENRCTRRDGQKVL